MATMKVELSHGDIRAACNEYIRKQFGMKIVDNRVEIHVKRGAGHAGPHDIVTATAEVVNRPEN